MRKLLAFLFYAAMAVLLGIAGSMAFAGSPSGLTITTVSTRPDAVTGGDVLAQIARTHDPQATVQVLRDSF